MIYNPKTKDRSRGEMEARRVVCVTGTSGFIGSILVMKLLHQGYHVRATVRDPGDENMVNHLLNLPNANTNLNLWKADLTDEGSFDDAINGCVGVFHVATMLDFSPADPEAKTVKRVIYTSPTATLTVHCQPPPEFDETVWTDVDFCLSEKMGAWMYYAAKTTAEKLAWEFADKNGIDLEMSFTIKGLTRAHGVHVEDVCEAMYDLANYLRRKYPQYSVPTEFEGFDPRMKPVPCFSKRLMELGFKFKYNPEEYEVGDLCSEAIESCRRKGLMPIERCLHV